MLAYRPMIERLIVLLDMEIDALKLDNQQDFSTFVEEKSRILLELPMVQPDTLTSDDQHLIKRLSVALGRNADALKHMMDATQAVSDVLAADLRAAQSDGTYNRGSYGYGNAS